MFTLSAPDGTFIPKRATIESAGYDVRVSQDVRLAPYEYVEAPTGLYLDNLTHGTPFHVDLRPRSSFFKHLVHMHLALIDADYENEIKILMVWQPAPLEAMKPNNIKLIEKGTRVAQLVVMQHYRFLNEETPTELRHGGLGSTGEK